MGLEPLNGFFSFRDFDLFFKLARRELLVVIWVAENKINIVFLLQLYFTYRSLLYA